MTLGGQIVNLDCVRCRGVVSMQTGSRTTHALRGHTPR